jgi:hypothetical protein
MRKWCSLEAACQIRAGGFFNLLAGSRSAINSYVYFGVGVGIFLSFINYLIPKCYSNVRNYGNILKNVVTNMTLELLNQ